MQKIYIEFYRKRFDWQDEALRQIKAQLYQYASFRNLQQEMDERIVITCGLPQSGKTEVILALLGVVQEKRAEIYTILRADQRMGTSSTASAMCYYAHAGEYFSLTGFPTQESKQTDLTAENLKIQLKELRKAVETDRFHSEIINIGIPRSYFDETEETVHLKIIDLPGIHSSNSKEEAQVMRIIQKYLAIANVVLFVCATNNVAQVEDSEISRTLDKITQGWRKNNEQFIFVPTGVFSRTYIDQSLVALITPQNVCRGILKNCEQELRRHLKKESETEESEVAVFPLELGNSLRTLEATQYPDALDPEPLIAQMRLQAEQSVIDLRNEIKKKQGKLPLHIVLTWLRQTKRLYAEEQKVFEHNLQRKKKQLKRFEEKLNRSERLYRDATNEAKAYAQQEFERIQDWIALEYIIKTSVIEKDDSWKFLQEKLQEKLPENVKKNCNKIVQPILAAAVGTFAENYKALLKENTKSLDLNVLIRDMKFNESVTDVLETLKRFNYPFGIEKKRFAPTVNKDIAIDKIMEQYESCLKECVVIPLFELMQLAEEKKEKSNADFQKGLNANKGTLEKKVERRKEIVNRAKQAIETELKQRAQAIEEAAHATELLENYERVIETVFVPEMKKWKDRLISEDDAAVKQKIALFMMLLQWDYDNLMTMERND